VKIIQQIGSMIRTNLIRQACRNVLAARDSCCSVLSSSISRPYCKTAVTPILRHDTDVVTIMNASNTSNVKFGPFRHQQLGSNTRSLGTSIGERRPVFVDTDQSEIQSINASRLMSSSSSSSGPSSVNNSSSIPSSSSSSGIPKRYRRDWKTYPTKSQYNDQQQFGHQFYPPLPSNQQQQHQQQQNHIVHHSEYMIPVYAIHIAQLIDLVPATLGSVIDKASSKKKLYGSRNFSYCVIELDNTKNKTQSSTTLATINGGGDFDRVTESASDMTHPGFIAIYPFGSVVFFNVSPADHDKYIIAIKKHCQEKVFPGTERTEKYNVLVRDDTIVYDDDTDLGSSSTSLASNAASAMPEQQQQHQQQQQQQEVIAVAQQEVTPDYCIVQKELNMDGVAVISTVMAQTVALDTYNDTVDELLIKFANINSTVKKTGKFTSHDRHFLFKTVATNNSIFIDMISKTRIKDRSDAAWALTEYSKIHNRLKDEFEIEDRFESIDFKLNLIQQNAKFFMEVLHYENSNKLEWVIVVLIAVECVLMMTDMSGNGDRLFGYVNSLLSSFSSSSEIVATTPIIEAVTDATESISSSIVDSMSNSSETYDISNNRKQ
jgi:uncharacterized Rmd1/YagE family protein